MSKMLVKQLLMSSNYWTLNKTIVNIFGIETALLLTTFAEAESMLADKEGWFYQTTGTIEQITTLKRYKQDKSIKELEDAGILIKDVRGMPAKKYFKIDYKALNDKIVGNQQTSMLENNKQDCWKSTTSKELSNKELSNKEHKEIKTKEPASAAGVPYKVIVDYFNEQTGKSIKHTARGNRKLISARWNEGYTVDDFKRVIDVKCEEWLGKGIVFSNGKPAETYLHPATLFNGDNFDKYLNQAPDIDKGGGELSEYEQLF